MKTKILFLIVISLFLISCVEPLPPVTPMVDKGDVLVIFDPVKPEQLQIELSCRGKYDFGNRTTVKSQLFMAWREQTYEFETEKYIYRVRMPDIRLWDEYLEDQTINNISARDKLRLIYGEEFSCHGVYLTDKNNLTATIYDEGHAEKRKINVNIPIDVSCNERDGCQIKYEFDEEIHLLQSEMKYMIKEEILYG